MKRDVVIIILYTYLAITCGCAAAVIGMGAAAGTGAAYIAGKDTRIYDAEYHQTVQACKETLSSLKIGVSQASSDELKTTIQARRADETPVHIEVVRVGPGRSEVGIRTGVFGISELRASDQIHDALMERLGPKAHELANATGTSKGEVAEPAQPPENLTRRGPGRKGGEPSPLSFTRRATPELTIYFGRDSNEILPSEMVKLDRVAETLSRQPEARLTLNGYTDAVGSTDYNLMIARSRASAVKLYLVARGVNPLRITVVGKGARDFAASNDTKEGRNLNRRVEINISGDR